ncbi:MAG: DNA-processing protein DprA [Oscillospiraceae bacterium]|nr:DNA-processing protein DprA [Oscillospiraceae bacterium]
MERYSHIPEITGEMAQALKDKDLAPAKAVIKSCGEKQIGIVTIGDVSYPSRLRNITDAPLVLYYKGVLPDFDGQPVISVVGTRKASAYGLKNAERLSKQIAACGGLVVSGGAAGIDTMALKGALEAGKQTVAVFGCGVDVVYPKTNRQLFVKIAEHGCLIAEYPPGTEPKPWQFPERNRILSGLADGVLVVEAPEKSGALITARNAFDQGRDVFVVPGNIDVATCTGSNALLQDCGAAVFSGWDVVKEYASIYPEAVENRKSEAPILMVAEEISIPRAETDKKYIDNSGPSAYSDLENILSTLSEQEKAIYLCLDSTARPADEVIAQVGLPAAVVLGVLTKLAIKGVVTNHPGGLVSANRS